MEANNNNNFMDILNRLKEYEQLLSGDEDGSSDPFIKVLYYGDSKESKVINDTLNPIWY